MCNNASFDIDLKCCSTDDLRKQIERWEPYAFTLVDEMRPLTLTDETINNIIPLPQEPPDNATETIKTIWNKCLHTANINLVNSVLYHGYLVLIKSGEPPVPPDQLAAELERHDAEQAEKVQHALTLKKDLENGTKHPTETITELVHLLPKADG